MWLGILLTLVFVIGFARIMVMSDLENIKNNWAQHRCDPTVMMFASLFKNKDDPRSDFQFTTDNFEFCASEIAKSALSVALKPVMDVFYQMANAAIQSIGFTMNLRTLGANLFNGLNRMFDIFTRRFNLTFHELHVSFLKQFTALEKANAIAIASVFSGISLIRSILNFFKLMIIVSIAILVIMVVLVIFLWFIFAPVTPLIIVAISVIAATGSAGAVGGMADAFCFSKNTTILLRDGYCSIQDIKIGDTLADGSSVTAKMIFNSDGSEELYFINGVIVSGSHLIYDGSVPIFVKDYKDAVPCEEKVSELYCLNTTSHKITVLSGNGPLEFADWEELGDDSMLSWDEYVRNFLNNASSKVAVKNSVLESESGFDISSLVTTKTGTIEIYKVGLGDIIFDGEFWTKIVGSVYIDGDHTEIMGRINSCKLSGASWIYENKKWIRAIESKQWKVEVPVKRLISLFTESGKFMVDGVVVRDFSDVGIHNINKTYDFTLSRLLQKCSLLNR